MIVLLCVAALGALIRQFAAPDSLLRNIGTLMMLLWLPVIGNVIAWLVARVRQPPTPESKTFGAPDTFKPHAWVDLTLRAALLPSEDLPIAVGEHRCALVVDNEGFSARWLVRPGETVRRGQPHTLQIEFLAPTAASQRLQSEAAFRMLVGEAFIGDGRVRQLLPIEA